MRPSHRPDRSHRTMLMLMRTPHAHGSPCPCMTLSCRARSCHQTASVRLSHLSQVCPDFSSHALPPPLRREVVCTEHTITSWDVSDGGRCCEFCWPDSCAYNLKAAEVQGQPRHHVAASLYVQVLARSSPACGGGFNLRPDLLLWPCTPQSQSRRRRLCRPTRSGRRSPHPLRPALQA